jgi:hypothetical protein
MGGLFGGSKPSSPAPAPPPPAPEPAPVEATDEARRRAARVRSRRAGRPLLGPGAGDRDDGLQTTLGVG